MAEPRFDLWLFFFSGLSGIALLLVAGIFPALAMPLTIACGILLANTHVLVTIGYYLDGENFRFYWQHRHWYFTTPLGLLLLAPVVALVSVPLAWSVHFLFTGWHVVRQSVGVNKLYGTRTGVPERDRKLDAGLIYATSLVLHVYAAFKYRLCFLDERLLPTPARAALFPLAAGLVALATAAFLLGVALSWWRGAGASPQRLAFGLISLLMYAPFLFVGNFALAFMVAILPHYLQYHGIFWLVARNKYRGKPAYAGTVIGRLADDVPLALGLLLLLALAMASLRGPDYLRDWLSLRAGLQVHPWANAALGLFFGVSWMHFYVDGLLFRFRHAHPRKSILPYLKSPASFAAR